MKVSNDLMMGVAIGVGVAFLLNANRGATAAPVITQGGTTYVPPMYPSQKQQKTGGAQMGGYPRRHARVNYPVYIGI